MLWAQIGALCRSKGGGAGYCASPHNLYAPAASSKSTLLWGPRDISAEWKVSCKDWNKQHDTAVCTSCQTQAENMTAWRRRICGTSTTLQGLTAEETFWWFGSITRSSLESISLRSLGTILSAIPACPCGAPQRIWMGAD